MAQKYDAYEEGYNEYCMGFSLDANPYFLIAEFRDMWKQGWLVACADDGRFNRFPDTEEYYHLI